MTDMRAPAGVFKIRSNCPSVLDGLTYTLNDLERNEDGRNRVMHAAFMNNPEYLTLYGERPVPLQTQKSAWAAALAGSLTNEKLGADWFRPSNERSEWSREVGYL